MKIRHLLKTFTVVSPLLLLFLLIGCGMGGVYIDDFEEPLPDDNTILRRHISSKISDGTMKISKSREDNTVTYIVVGRGGAFPPIRYVIVYELVDGYWKHVSTRDVGHM